MFGADRSLDILSPLDQMRLLANMLSAGFCLHKQKADNPPPFQVGPFQVRTVAFAWLRELRQRVSRSSALVVVSRAPLYVRCDCLLTTHCAILRNRRKFY